LLQFTIVPNQPHCITPNFWTWLWS
jgi:hypothetical protein